MKDSARHSCIMIGIVLIVIAGIMMYFALSDKRVYVDADSSTVPHSEYTDYVLPTSSPNQDDILINLNTADVSDLMQIDGIGEELAIRIIDYRDHIGGFTSVDQLEEIKGVGQSRLEMIKQYVTI